SAAQIYEQPASEFVAGFVGTSNLISGAAAVRLLGRDATFSVRPEKIRISTDLRSSDDSETVSAKGTVADVVYAGASTRFIVDLDAGGRLVAVRQNTLAPTEALDHRGATVRLSWRRQHCITIDGHSRTEEES
ncbi:MAG: TOBE domain-containing protein, partial [Propionibacteriales bacterium]|nr:TOBE domain-containing protein [Propionibacteriales bacterium]